MADEDFGDEFGDYFFDDDYLYVEDEYAIAVSPRESWSLPIWFCMTRD